MSYLEEGPNSEEPTRTWGLFFIPRDKAPTEGFFLAHTSPGRSGPKRQARWRAWWLPLTGRSVVTREEAVIPEGPHYRANANLVSLLLELTEDHT